MINIRPVILPAKPLSNGKHRIRIAVSHNSSTRYIPTELVIDSPKQFRGGFVVNRADASYMNTKIAKLVSTYREACDEIPYATALSCSELISAIKTEQQNRFHTLKSVYEELVASRSIKDSTASVYRTQFTCITNIIDENILLDRLSPVMIQDFTNKLFKLKLSNSYIKLVLCFLRQIVRYAMRMGYVVYKVDPFINCKIPQHDVRDTWVKLADIKKIRDVDVSGNTKIVADLFMLSFYLGGMNYIDIKKLKFTQMDTIRYIRSKTDARSRSVIEFNIPDEAKSIIRRYWNKKGTFSANISVTCIRYNLNKIATICGIKRLIFYSARKTFSQLAFELGVNTSVIDYILGHSMRSSGSCLYHYITVSPEMATEAIRKVLDSLK